MNFRISQISTLLTIVLLSTSNLSAQIVKHERLLSFEHENVPEYIKVVGGELSTSDVHYKDGARSLRWEFAPLGEVVFNCEVPFEARAPKSRDLYLSTFVVWIYNAEPADKIVRFEFLKDSQVQCSFPFNINFRGWRTAWVCFERDMEGKPTQGMNAIRVVAPDTHGELYIDHMMTAVKTDPRHQTADYQVPFVNTKTDSHWQVLLHRSRLKPDIAAESTITDSQKEQLNIIEKRFRDLILTPTKVTPKTLEQLRTAYNKYNIVYKDGVVSGMPIFFSRATEAYERLEPKIDGWKNLMESNNMEVKAYFDLMNKIAIAYNNAPLDDQRQQLRTMFLSMYDHIYDQGVAYGSCWGNFTHYGYSWRGFYTSYFLMKDALRDAGKLTDAERAMQWYAMANEVFIAPNAPGMDMDAFNTVTTGRIASIMMMENTPQKVQYMRAYSRWINNGCLPANGLAGAFKTDGGAFHHRNNYPAYAVGGLEGATNMIYLLSKTDFAVSELGHKTVKNVLLTMRFYCNKRHFPLSMSGRHPDGKGKLIPIQYAMMAIAGTPGGKGEYDPQMAAAYLRLVSGNTAKDDPEYMPYVTSSREKELKQLLASKGYRAEGDPQGNLALGYGSVSVQRRDNWAAVVRGHSRYLWASEHYAANNFYGRYLAHGSMQILTAGDQQEVTPATSLWQQEGFDWGRIPGTTAIHLPVEQLRAQIYNVDAYSGVEEMLYSDQEFAGGISQQGLNGTYAMKLHEHDKYNGSHRARKSFHMFDNRIICLGSDIGNTNADYPTQTTVFQLAATDSAAINYWNNYSGGTTTWLDNANTGYYVPEKQSSKVRFEKNFPQYSRQQNNGEPTQGNWVSLVVDHGKAPKNGGYEYVVMPKTSAEALAEFAHKPSYTVLQRDSNAHIVHDRQTQITSYVLFEKAASLPKGILMEVDTSALVMVRGNGKSIVLTVANPDLALYRGASDEKFDANGKRTERSIYSRGWIDNPSGEIPVRVTLKGAWMVSEPNTACRVISTDKHKTILEFACKDGASFDVGLFSK